MSLRATASQTVGPFFEIGLAWLYRGELADGLALRGRVLDGDGQPIPDAVLEFWHADERGRYRHPEDARAEQVADDFVGFARVATARDGGFALRTRKPGALAQHAPHINVVIFMRGLLKAVYTRVYFAGEPANEADPVLALVPAARRSTLLARRDGERTFVWDVHMQGEHETAFFEF